MPFNARAHRKEIAESSLKAIENGSFLLNNRTHFLPSSAPNTHLYMPSDLSEWSATPRDPPNVRRPQISIMEISTLEAAKLLSTAASTSSSGHDAHARVGVLNFASAKHPGGGFLNGAQAQEESIARSSTLYTSLTSTSARDFYTSHTKDARGGYYSHAIIWSPDIIVFRSDDGSFIEPFKIQVITSPAVNAGVVRKHTNSMFVEQEEKRIESVMKERMARILFVLESRGVSKVVLGSFGTGVFQNSVPMVARLWAELLGCPGSRFEFSFESVLFGIIGNDTYKKFKHVFERTCRGDTCES